MIGIDRIIARWSFYDAFLKAQIVDERGCTRWIPYGMPLIPPEVLNCCFYLYKTVEDAKTGRPFGGTGFLVGVPSALDQSVFHVFGVTNWHVAVRDGFSVMRFNRDGGGVGVFKRDPADWIWRPKWHDLAIIGLPDMEGEPPAEATVIHRDLLLTKEETARLGIGPGADVFMVGRFVDHDGKDANVPAVRFGHVSVMPRAIKQPTGATLETYVLDVHSRTGYSGSPVFVYRTPGTDLRFTNIVTGPGANFVRFLGVHWGQFTEKWKITAAGKVKPSSAQRRFIGEAEIDGLSGMTCAVPSWALRELLDDPRAQAFVAEQEGKLRAKFAVEGAPPVPESAS